VVQTLTEQNWQVIVLSFPETLVPKRALLPEGIPRIELMDQSEAELKQKLAAITTNHGSIGAFIHLHPRWSLNPNGNLTYLETDKTLIRQVFLLAKHLKKLLNAGDSLGRKCFLSVARLDGAFGLSQNIEFSPISAGLFGLTKSLNHEWPEVFCRAIDLSPELDSKASAKAILAEIHDPNLGITEVAYGEQGRTTLVCEE
jgi:hypothetical protein